MLLHSFFLVVLVSLSLSRCFDFALSFSLCCGCSSAVSFLQLLRFLSFSASALALALRIFMSSGSLSLFGLGFSSTFLHCLEFLCPLRLLHLCFFHLLASIHCRALLSSFFLSEPSVLQHVCSAPALPALRCSCWLFSFEVCLFSIVSLLCTCAVCFSPLGSSFSFGDLVHISLPPCPWWSSMFLVWYSSFCLGRISGSLRDGVSLWAESGLVLSMCTHFLIRYFFGSLSVASLSCFFCIFTSAFPCRCGPSLGWVLLCLSGALSSLVSPSVVVSLWDRFSVFLSSPFFVCGSLAGFCL